MLASRPLSLSRDAEPLGRATAASPGMLDSSRPPDGNTDEVRFTAIMRNPFIVGSWVRADNFFGRSSLMERALEGAQDSVWIVGARRMGKTSVLKELEYRTIHNPQSAFVPLYWDLEGSGDARGLAEGLLDAVEDSEAFRRAIDLGIEEVEGLNVVDMLATLVRRTVRSGWRLLLLIDEGEEFLAIARNDLSTLLRIRRVLQKGPDIRTVMTSTRRLARIDERVDYVTSPFLQGFVPPCYLAPLEASEARALLARGQFSDDECTAMMDQTSRHPFLLQLLASRLFESRDLASVIGQVSSDEMIANFFAVDFQTLEPLDRRILEELARAGRLQPADLARSIDVTVDALDPTLIALRTMGYVSFDGDACHVGNAFFDRWLRRAQALPTPEVAS